MNTAKLITLGLLRGSGAVDTSASFTVTTTGAQTLTINGLTVSASTTVDWGDGSSDDYTGSGTRTHNYAGAGTWAMRIMQPQFVTTFDVRDAKANIDAGAIGKFRNLTFLTILNATASTAAGEIGLLTSLGTINISTNNLAIGTGEIDNLTALTILSFINMPNVTIGASEIGALTELTLLTLINSPNIAPQTGLASLTKMTTFRYENNLTTAQVNSVFSQLWAGFAARTAVNGTIDLLGGGNEGPTGPVAAENPPTYGGAYVHELVNDTGGVNPTHKWLSASTATPV